MSITAIVRALVGAGASPEMILAAVEAAAESATPKFVPIDASEAGKVRDWHDEARREGRRRKAKGEPTNPRAMGINPRALGTNPRAGRSR